MTLLSPILDENWVKVMTSPPIFQYVHIDPSTGSLVEIPITIKEDGLHIGNILVPNVTSDQFALISQLPTSSTFVDLSSAQIIANTKTFSGNIKTTGGAVTTSTTTGDIVVAGGIGVGTGIFCGGSVVCPAINNGGNILVPNTNNNTTDQLVCRATTDTLTNKTIDGGSNNFSNIPANRIIATATNQPIITNSSKQLVSIPYINANQGGTAIDSSSMTGLPFINSGTWTVTTSPSIPTLNVDTINGKTNTNIISMFGGYVTEYFGTLVGQTIGTSAYVTLLTLPTIANKNYLAEFDVNAIVTSGTHAGLSRAQVTQNRYKNISGVVTTSAVSNGASSDFTANGANLFVDTTVTPNPTINFQYWLISGDTTNLSYYVKVVISP